jgi:hypothetical protein
MKSLKHFFFGLVTLSLVACAFDKNSNNDNQKELDDNAQLAQKFSRVTGLYRGTVSTSQGLQQIELNVTPFSKKIGQNSNGEDKFKLELRARYRRLDTVVDDVILGARYYEETSQILFANADENTSPKINIEGRATGDEITGNVSQNTFPLGQLNVQLVSREYENNNPNEQDEKNNRLRKLYDTIKGDYTGVVKSAEEDPFGINVKIFHNDEDIGGISTTVLKAKYNLNSDPDRSLELLMNGNYKPDTNPPSITLKSISGGIYTVTIKGTLVKGVLTGTFTNQRGVEGSVTLTKKR